MDQLERHSAEFRDDGTSVDESPSPLATIIQDLRRKNLVTASLNSGPYASHLDSTDPWGSSDALDGEEEQQTAYSNNPQPSRPTAEATPRNSWVAARRNSWIGSRPSPGRISRRRRSNSKVLQGRSIRVRRSDVDMQSVSPSYQRLLSWLNSTRLPQRESPQHAEALLQDTPQLRIVSPASTDMQGVGSVSPSGFLSVLLSTQQGTNGSTSGGSDTNGSTRTEYMKSLARERANKEAAAELSSVLWILAHEMSLEAYGIIESEVFTSVFALVHAQEIEKRMAGLAALDAMIDAPSADEEKKAIKFANTLSKGLRSALGDYEFLSAASKALGHMAMRSTNVDFVESEITTALEWLRTERSDRRLAAALSLKQLAIHAPTTLYSKTSQAVLGHGGSSDFLEFILLAVHDPQPIVRASSADALSRYLKILVERQQISLTSLLWQVHHAVLEGFKNDQSKKNRAALNKMEAAQHGSLLVVGTMIALAGDFMLPRYDEVCQKIMTFMDHEKALMRLEVIRLIPRLARRCPRVFARRYLEQSLDFLIHCASAPTQPRIGIELRPSAYSAIGGLMLAMVDEETGSVIGGGSLPTIKITNDSERSSGPVVEMQDSGPIYQRLDVIFSLVSDGLNYRSVASPKTTSKMHIAAFHCGADLVEALGNLAEPYITRLINDIFKTGLSNDLIQCLHAIAECLPAQQGTIEDRLLQAVSYRLAGIKSARDVCDPLIPLRTIYSNEPRHGSLPRLSSEIQIEGPARAQVVRINMSTNANVVADLVLSLQTLSSFGDSMGRVTTLGAVVPLLPFVQNVAAKYLSHPSSEVRRAAALTCCLLLVPPQIVSKNRVSHFSGQIIQDILDTILRVAVSDSSPEVRLCAVKALDKRYDPFLCQSRHLQTLFLLLQDEVLATRAAGVRLLGRLAQLNPAPILPFMRKFLLGLIVEIRCGVDTGRGREEATRLLVVFLRSGSVQRLIQPVLSVLVASLPLDGGAPRLASAALEALGELSRAAGASLQPWVKEVVPTILDTLQDQSSASKQRISLRTLAQIAGSTGYVIQPYMDYPKLLLQATDILPGTKRAPWALRREVIRTLGVLGALDPDRYHAAGPKARKGGAVGGAYFVVQDEVEQPTTDVEMNGAVVGRSLALRNFGGNSVAAGSVLAKPLPHHAGTSKGKQDESGRADVPWSVAESADADDNLPAYLSMYEQYAMVAQPVSTLPPARRMTPGDEEFYPTVAIQALMRIFKDPALAVHHGMVMQAIMFIFQSLGLRCVQFLNDVVPHIMLTIRTCGPSNLRESLLKQVATLSGIVKEHLRPYVADVFDIVEQLWESKHLGTIFSLVFHIAVGVPDEFRNFIPRLIRRVLTSLDELQVAEWANNDPRSTQTARLKETERLRLILFSVKRLRGVLGDYVHVLVPALLKLTDSLVRLQSSISANNIDWVTETDLESITILGLDTTSALLECEGTGVGVRPVTLFWGEKSGSDIRSGSLASRVVQPLIRLLKHNQRSHRNVGMAIVETLCVSARQLGRSIWMNLYHDVAKQAINEWHFATPEIDNLNMGDEYHVSTVNVNTDGVQLYGAMIKELQDSPNKRSYNSPYVAESFTSIQRRDSSIFHGMDPLQQPVFADNPGTPATFDAAADVFENPIPSQPLSIQANKKKINQSNLQRAWDVSQCASREDWDEWMRRLGIQLLREAPSPSLRAAASLANAYQPLARELFSAGFVCCWKELSQPYRANLVHCLETAFVADVSPEILQTLLNLAEFMEHDPSGGLPIDIPILAELALKCRAYAKALHYKEREHSMGVTNSCVESLISINRKLGLQDAALGVLKSATMAFEDKRFNSDQVRHEISSRLGTDHGKHEMYYGVVWSAEDHSASNTETLNLAENRELWLAKLGSWSDALEVYEEKLARNPNDFGAVLGCMRCLSATGDWRRVLELAEYNWDILKTNFSGSETRTGKKNNIARGQKKAFRMCSEAAWRLGSWDDLEKYSSELVQGRGSSTPPSSAVINPASGNREGSTPLIDFEGSFFSAVLHVHRQEWTRAAEAIDDARKAMDSRFTALMAESYNRAYSSMVTAQTLAELEEVIEYHKIEKDFNEVHQSHPSNRMDPSQAREKLLSVWRTRLAGCRVDADVHSSILAVRSLVLGPTDEVDATLTLSELSRQAQRFRLAERVLLNPLEALEADLDGAVFGFGLRESLGLHTELQEAISELSVSRIINDLLTNTSRAFLPEYGMAHNQWSKELVREAGGLDRLKIQHKLYFAYLKHLWLTDRKGEAIDRLGRLCDVVDLVSNCESAGNDYIRASCWLELGEWKMEEKITPGKHITGPLQVEILCDFKRASMIVGCGYKAWHAWALLNFRLALQMDEREENLDGSRHSHDDQDPDAQRKHVVSAIKAFFSAISLGTKRWSASVQQDMLNLLTCLFKYGDQPAIASIIKDGVDTVAIETWLGVLPQLLARIQIKNPSIRSVLHPLLVRLGEKHPQALMYPLSVLLKSPVSERKSAAESLMTSLRSHSSALVEEALMVSSELIRVAILWLETWHEGLEEASRLHFGEGNVAGMLDLLLPLHQHLENGADTQKEIEFVNAFGRDLAQAHSHLKDYVRLVTEGGGTIPGGTSAANVRDASSTQVRQNEEAETAMNKAWDIYYTVFRRINKQLPALTKLELSQCSPALSRAQGLELGVPGSYRVDGSYVKIERFIPSVQVITSKQRPRKITLRGSDGKDYVFLLKGHEDLRQDERVMQLFGLVNALLERDRQTKKHDLRIQRYAISPLSHNCGLVGWVPHTDTLHSLIRDYRQSKKTPLNLEHREMTKLAPDYDMLTVMQKVEVFCSALRRTKGGGNDLYEILWLKSTNSEEWLERRTKFTRSLAVMSIVGYILGLGDRHPSNLMLDKRSGRVLHIDFGDCFEVAMNRDKYPEKVPFRLTRMLIKAMEVSGIEGSYRTTCERTMTVLRESRDSLVAMLEAFVHDPLISWRLVDLSAEDIDRQSSVTETEASTPRNAARGAQPSVPADLNRSNLLNNPITEAPDEDGEDADAAIAPNETLEDVNQQMAASFRNPPNESVVDARRARSLQMYANIQEWAANGRNNGRKDQVAASGSVARSRMERSIRQRELLSILEDGLAHDEVLNEKALTVIRRVQDKLTGTDFPDREDDLGALDVSDQVQRLIVQATSVENLCQLFIGW
mmetsp:Transcript_21493/g.52973  ORF Transcript_21493/g.52973 Transcript_21493/m.52973 type:complete len:3171 (+) Transcript_21493:99-9611(+)